MRWVILLLLLWLFVGPRIEIPAGRGARVEDLVFAALAIICAVQLRPFRRIDLRTAAVVAVASSGLLSAAIAVSRGTVEPVTAALFALRPLEYWIAFPATLLLLRGTDVWMTRMNAVLATTTVLQTAFAVAQYYFSLPIGFSHAAYTRAAGLTVGPYELGAISAVLLVYWVARRTWVLASLSTIALAASISRISIIGAAAALAVLISVSGVRLLRRGRRPGQSRTPRRPVLRTVADVAAVAVSVAILALTLGIVHLPAGPSTDPIAEAPKSVDASPAASPSASFSATEEPTADVPTEDAESTDPQGVGIAAPSESVATRLASTSVLGSWEASRAAAAAVPHSATAASYQAAAYADLQRHLDVEGAAAGGGEPSNLVRFFRWHLILDTVDDPLDVIFGLGPSFTGPSVDGSYLRMFADGGVIGLLAWLALIVTWFRRAPLWMTCIVVALLVGAVFIDILYAQRPMALFWALLAIAATRRRSERVEPELELAAATRAGAAG